MYKKAFDQIAQYFGTDRFSEELGKAQEDYFHQTGKVFEDEPSYEPRMNAFFEWFLLDRPLFDYGIPPVRLYRVTFAEKIDSAMRMELLAYEQSYRSIFTYRSHKDGRVEVKELREKETLSVSEKHNYSGIRKGDLLDARLVQFGEERVFTDSMWVHPSEVTVLVTRELKKKEWSFHDYEQFMFRLAYMKWKHEKYSHASVKQIYNWDEAAPSAVREA